VTAGPVANGGQSIPGLLSTLVNEGESRDESHTSRTNMESQEHVEDGRADEMYCHGHHRSIVHT